MDSTLFMMPSTTDRKGVTEGYIIVPGPRPFPSSSLSQFTSDAIIECAVNRPYYEHYKTPMIDDITKPRAYLCT
jgi:hypothetical protein